MLENYHNPSLGKLTVKLGSEAHKELFCRSFIESHLEYEPEKLPWPALDRDALERLRSIPFWSEALRVERRAGIMVAAFAQTIQDPLIREAIALQGREESRHGRLIQFMLNHYQIEVPQPPEPQLPRKMNTAFTNFGFSECLDSFFAFGMFALARQSQYFPEALFSIFDPILQEECRHIVFFVNWVTYQQIQQGKGNALFRSVYTLWHYRAALQDVLRIISGAKQPDGKRFTTTGGKTFTQDLTLEQVLTTCLQENAQRMSAFDARLLRPTLLPTLSEIALKFVKRMPQKNRPTRSAVSASNP
jgi:hypothetical protein